MRIKMVLNLIITGFTGLLLSSCGVPKIADNADIAMASKGSPDGTISGSEIQTFSKLYKNRDIAILVQTGNNIASNQPGFYIGDPGAACYVLKDGLASKAKGCSFVPESQIERQEDPDHYVNTSGHFTLQRYEDKQGELRLLVYKQLIQNRG